MAACMPLFEFACQDCGALQEHITRYGEHRTDEYPCEKEVWHARYDKAFPCGGIARYAGLSQTVVGNSHQFGVILENGQKVAGNLGKSAPNKRLQKK
jgi:hypothetical protein